MDGRRSEYLGGKRVLVIVPGTANTISQCEALGREIANRTHASFDAYVVFIWPCGATGLAYLATKFLNVRRASKFLAEALYRIHTAGCLTLDIDAHSLGVPIALEAFNQTEAVVDGIWAKAGHAKSRPVEVRRRSSRMGTSVNVFYSPRDLIVSVLYRIWFGFSGSRSVREKSKGGNIGVQWDVTSEIKGSHIDYRRCSIVIQAMFEEAKRRLRVNSVWRGRSCTFGA